MTPLNVFVIADYGPPDDMAFGEVEQKILGHYHGTLGDCDATHSDRPITVSNYSVPAFNTVATGFKLAQLAINSSLGDMQKFFVNTAPRKDDANARKQNDGEKFVYAKLFNGIEICAVNSGHSLSFIKSSAEEIRAINCASAGSQFRSRDVFPEAFVKIIKGDRSLLGRDLMDEIPEPPKDCVAVIDGYGNIKTTLTEEKVGHLKGKKATVTMIDPEDRNKQHHEVMDVAEGMFAVRDGRLCMFPGSSGWTDKTGVKHVFYEVAVRGGNAARKFGYPERHFIKVSPHEPKP